MAIQVRVFDEEKNQMLVDGKAMMIAVVIVDAQGNLALAGSLPPPIAAMAAKMLEHQFVFPALVDHKPSPIAVARQVPRRILGNTTPPTG